MGKHAAIRNLPKAYVVSRFATVRKGLRVTREKDLVVGQGATVVGSITSAGRVYLGKGVVVRGDVTAHGDVVVGAYARVEGQVRSESFVLVQEGASVMGRIGCPGEVAILGAWALGPVEAGGDIRVRSPGGARRLKAGGRVVSDAEATDEPHQRR